MEMDLQTRLSTLPQPARVAVVSRVFKKMSLANGWPFLKMWAGYDMDEVYSLWVDVLNNCSIGAIAFACDECIAAASIPSAGEFLRVCKSYIPIGHAAPVLEHKLTEEELQANRDRLAEIRRVLASKMTVESGAI